MKELEINYLGPVIQSGKMRLRPYTILIGPQGSGKSTIAKMISVCSWIEKSLVRENLTPTYVEQYNRFQKKYCSYHHLEHFFCKETSIRYTGEAYTFLYEHGSLKISKNASKRPKVPQITYIPAERNFLTALEQAEKIRKLPPALATLQEEYASALQNLPKWSAKDGQEMHDDKSDAMKQLIGDVSVQYDKLNRITSLVGKDYRIRLNEAASGYQSIVPLVLVIQHLRHKLSNAEAMMSYEERERYRQRLKALLDNKGLDETGERMISEMLSTTYRNDYLLAIIEEPEQNLFPQTQYQLMKHLVSSMDVSRGDQLVMTTHSPYVMTSLNNFLEAGNIIEDDAQKSDDVIAMLGINAVIHFNDVSAFAISDGYVKDIMEVENKLISADVIDQASITIGHDFDNLLSL